MFSEFFQLLPIPKDYLQGSYDLHLVILSYMVALCASYIALDLTGRLRDISNTPSSNLLWLLGGSVAMGSGIWAMHFIGMLSFTIPGISLRYDLFWTGLSLVVAIVASCFALYLLQSTIIRIEHYIAGGIILGLAIASMHYTGMEAMLISLNFRYLPSLFFLSILIAIVASEAALWLALKSNQVVLRLRNRIKFISAAIMGVAICGMHYTGMAASIFTSLCVPSAITSSIDKALDPTYLSIGVASVTFAILGIAFLASSYKEALNHQQLEKARQLGMAEISASVLHNVGNVLNSVNVSANSVAEKVSFSKLDGLEKLSALFNENKPNLAEFIQSARGAKALDFLNMLAQYWREEQSLVAKEMVRLDKNLALIREIISTQQELSKIASFEQIISINELLDEALLITGISLKREIKLEKHYGKISPLQIDKIKLLQVLVNLLQNARDAVLVSSKQDKMIVITSATVNAYKVRIEISDNGIGILPKDLTKIFSYGFTTKKLGHGFGLHTSALAINALGGEIHVESAGVEKGATFILDIPFHHIKSK